MKTTPTQARVRLTISVTPEVHDTFTRMAHAGGMSVSRAMGDWLSDTSDAANYAAQLLEKARSAPREVVRQMHSYALGISDETSAVMDMLRSQEADAERGDAAAAARAGAVQSPPSCNTGGKVPRKGQSKGSGSTP